MIDAVLSPITEITGLAIDQVRYAFLLFLSFPLAYLLRVVLHPRRTSPTVRHLYNVVLGVWFSSCCFGWQTFYLVGMTGIGYVFLLIFPPQTVQRHSMLLITVCITASHLYRMITDYGGYHADFTAPLMVIVQRVTYVAFAIHDGLGRKEEELTVEQRRLRLKQIPSLLEYSSYNLSFLTLLVGPTVAYKEYQDFITGDNYKQSEESGSYHYPSPLFPAAKTFLLALFFVLQFLYLATIFTEEWLLSPDIGFFMRMFLVSAFVYTLHCRHSYVWHKAESICNTAGLGFHGYDKQGQPQWDLAKCVDPVGFIFGTSLRRMTLSWNVSTQTWLRRVCYERLSFMPLATTWAFSALWHGLYPGYYLCFGSLALGSIAGRKFRRFFRPRFQSSPRAKLAYDVVTWLGAVMMRDFAGTALVLLLIDKSFQVWRSVYFVPLIVVVLIILLVPDPKKEKEKPSAASNDKSANSQLKKADHVD